MQRWKYRARNDIDGSIFESTIDMPAFEDNQAKCVKRIDELRQRLRDRGYQFIDARPLNDIEKASNKFEEHIERLSSGRLREPKRSFRSIYLLCLVLLGLLVCLGCLWRLYM